MAHSSHESYFANQPEDIQARLAAIQSAVEAKLPGITRCIGYGMPAYRARTIFFYFAAFKKHIGIYPPVKHERRLIAELAPYRGPKGNLSFPHSEPLPLDLIIRVAQALYREYAHHESKN